MQNLKNMEIGLMFWGEFQPQRTLAQIKALGMRCGHLGFAGHVSLADAGAEWKKALEAEQFVVTSIWAAFEGESYADIPTVKRTVGFIPRETREIREARAREVIDLGAMLGIGIFASHIGFVPDDPSNADYVAVREIVRRICDHAARHKMIFALETGQEPAPTLMHFIEDVGRENLKINFDPANIVMYGTGDPIEALGVMAPKVVSVHVKDGTWPPAGKPGALGSEMPLGQGEVGMERFVKKLKEIGYQGPLVIEREVDLTQDMDDRHKEGISHLDDIRGGISLLRGLAGEVTAA
jgi:sugar phosphate isomerase/epimerase